MMADRIGCDRRRHRLDLGLADRHQAAWRNCWREDEDRTDFVHRPLAHVSGAPWHLAARRTHPRPSLGRSGAIAVTPTDTPEPIIPLKLLETLETLSP
jgi:hypothetical protein